VISTIYIENAVRDHPLTIDVLDRFPAARRIPCDRYGDVFNAAHQDFRLQKRLPSLVLAGKFAGHVLEAPPGYGFGGRHSYYFSHLLNCLYDCRYCFLQGMYRSAHYVLFVNYEDFEREIDRCRQRHDGEPVWFFSGYDCDSLALEPLTRFAERFLDFFAARPDAWLELRTKSTQTRCLHERQPLENVVVAFSFTPEEVSSRLEKRVPPLARRIDTAAALARRGWQIGLRFDPVIAFDGWRRAYDRLFATLVERIPRERLHSVSLGAFRMPVDFFRRIERMFPDEALYAGPFETRSGVHGYRAALERELLDHCRGRLADLVPAERLFECDVGR
jgi:spore photoproduct lyase